MKKSNIIKSGILNENPVFVMFLGTCPTLATTNSTQIGRASCRERV